MTELKIIARKNSWAFEELVYDAKATEANQITNAGLNKQYQYLVKRYGSKQEVLRMLRALVIDQRERRKTLHLYQQAKHDGAGVKVSNPKGGRKR